jgi:hypothetical protein
MLRQHFSPKSSLFKPQERNDIIVSDIGVVTMSVVLYLWATEIGFAKFLLLYGVPYIVNIGCMLIYCTDSVLANTPLDRHADVFTPL